MRVIERIRSSSLRGIVRQSAIHRFFFFDQSHDLPASCIVCRARQLIAKKPQIFTVDEPLHRSVLHRSHRPKVAACASLGFLSSHTSGSRHTATLPCAPERGRPDTTPNRAGYMVLSFRSIIIKSTHQAPSPRKAGTPRRRHTRRPCLLTGRHGARSPARVQRACLTEPPY